MVEFLGTLLFLSVILASGRPVVISLAFLLVLVLGGSISGGHFNPAVSIMFWAKGALNNQDLMAYIAAQVLGGLAALWAYRTFLRAALVKSNLLLD